MKEVKVKRVELLLKVRTNRDAHVAELKLAKIGWRDQVEAAMVKNLRNLRAGRDFERYVALDMPQDHTADYDRVVSMLDMSADEDIVLTAQEFDQYVMDNWAWANHKLLNSGYAMSASAKVQL